METVRREPPVGVPQKPAVSAVVMQVTSRSSERESGGGRSKRLSVSDTQPRQPPHSVLFPTSSHEGSPRAVHAANAAANGQASMILLSETATSPVIRKWAFDFVQPPQVRHGGLLHFDWRQRDGASGTPVPAREPCRWGGCAGGLGQAGSERQRHKRASLGLVVAEHFQHQANEPRRRSGVLVVHCKFAAISVPDIIINKPSMPPKTRPYSPNCRDVITQVGSAGGAGACPTVHPLIGAPSAAGHEGKQARSRSH